MRNNMENNVKNNVKDNMREKEEKIIQKAIQKALDNTSTGNWLISNEELEKAGINFDDFCDKLEDDDRVCEYELTENGINILFWLDYCKYIIEEEKE